MSKTTYAYLPFVRLFPLPNKLGSKPFSAYTATWPLGIFAELCYDPEDLSNLRESSKDYIVYRVDATIAKNLSNDFSSSAPMKKRLDKMVRKGNAFFYEERLSSDLFSKKELLWRYGKPELGDNSWAKYKVLILHDSDIIIPIYAMPTEGQVQDISHSKPYSLAKEWLKKFNISASLSIVTMGKSDVRPAGCTKTSSKLGKRILENLPVSPH